jgi:hypothetical protein
MKKKTNLASLSSLIPLLSVLCFMSGPSGTAMAKRCESPDDECVDDLVLEDAPAKRCEYRARRRISAKQVEVPPDYSVVFRSGRDIILKNGFQVQTGAEFRAWIDSSVPCDEGDGDDTEPGDNLIALHDSRSDQYETECKSCHEDIHSRETFDPAIPAAHLAMSPFAAGEPGSDQQCRWCHRTVDLAQGTQTRGKSIGNLRRHVDATLCTLCHGPYRDGPGAQLYQSGLSPTQPDGPLLYGLVCSGCHGNLDNSDVRGEDAQEIREKIAEDEGGMGVLSILSNEEIDALVAALAH